MPVQAQVLKLALDGLDVTVQSQTGSGKTAAFLVALFQHMLNRKQDPSLPAFSALILVPTRELAVQIEDEARLLGAHLGLKIIAVYGGVGYGNQTEALRNKPDLVVGTPGRLLDLAGSGRLNLLSFSHLVVDEADRMLDMGFYPDIEKIIRQMVPPTKRQTMLFSATLGEDVKRLAVDFMNNPGDVTVTPEQVTVEKISQSLYHVGRDEKTSLLLGLLRKYNPNSVLVFTNTKRMAEELARRLQGNGYAAEFIMGDLPQAKRLKIIDDIKAGKLKFLVATDVASRGLHIDDLTMVVNYDLPENPENYVHRIGRTARAGKDGIAVTFACQMDVDLLEPIQHYINMKIPVVWAGEEEFVEDKSRHMRREHSDSGRDRGHGRHGGGRDRGRRGDRSGRPPRREDQIKQSISSILETGTPQSSPAASHQQNTHPHTGHEPQHRKDRPRQPQKPHAPHARSAGPGASGHGQPKSGRSHEGHPGEQGRRSGGHHDRRNGHGGNEFSRYAGQHSSVDRPGRNASAEERLAYYRKVYGENFKMGNSVEGKKKSAGGLIHKIKGLFKKKK
jgi:ATP-dependent RNA helicase RhlB